MLTDATAVMICLFNFMYFYMIFFNHTDFLSPQLPSKYFQNFFSHHEGEN